MFIDLDKAITVKMFGKCTHNKGFWHDQKTQNQNQQTLTSNLFLYVTDGSFNIQIDKKIYNVSSGDIVVIPFGTVYQPRESDGCTYYFLHFSSSVIEDTVPPNMLRSLIKYVEDDKGYIYNYYGSTYKSIVDVPIHIKHNQLNTRHKISDVINRAIMLNFWQNDSVKLLLDNIMRELLILISADFTTNNQANSALQKILLYISKNYMNPITLTSLADTFEVSTSYITKSFRTFLGKGTVDYINDLRLVVACEYLISSNLSIGDISDRIGFSNQYYFDRLFKRKYGITPKDFRKANYNEEP